MTATVQRRWANEEEHRARIADTVNQILKGKINNYGSVTLTASQATTVVTDPRVGVDSCITFMPKTANAAAEVGAGGMYVSSRGDKTFTITHANNAQTDRDFIYAVNG